NNIIRYNISENDGRRNYYSGIHVWSYDDYGIQDSEIFNNTIYVSPSTAAPPNGIAIVKKTINIGIRNNIIVTTGGVPLHQAAPGQIGIKVQGNCHWTTSSAFRIKWNGKDYANLSVFRDAGQERVDGSDVGFNGDPQLAAPGAGVIIGDPDNLGLL